MCNHEQDVLDAVQSGRWSEELRAHFTDCSDCADLAIVAGALHQESELALEESRLPSASFLWWKSKLRARREAEEKVLQPVRVAEKVALAAGAAGIAGLTWWLWPTNGLRDLSFLTSSTLAMGTGAALISLLGFAVYAVMGKE
jgi:hypothetical protein